jgi:hypothetical protein
MRDSYGRRGIYPLSRNLSHKKEGHPPAIMSQCATFCLVVESMVRVRHEVMANEESF